MQSSESRTANPTWLPSDLMDEMIPTPRSTPDAWIASLNDGAPALDWGDDGEDGRPKGPMLKDGDVVNFQSCTKYGEAVLTFRAAADWSVDRPMPPEAKQVCAMRGWQTDSLASTVEECVENLIEHEAEPGEYELSYFTWSDDIPHRFDAKTRSFGPAGLDNG